MSFPYKCPNCSERIRSVVKIFIADVLGWGVRCQKCNTRTSHSKTIRWSVRVLILCVLPSLLIASQITEIQTGSWVLGGIVLSVVLTLLFYSRLILREPNNNKAQLAVLFKVLAVIGIFWLGTMLVYVYTANLAPLKETLLSAGLFAGPCVLLSIAISLFQNWTI